MADNAIPLERTLALIKPDSVDDSSEIERIIKTSGFAILAKRRVNLSPEQVSDFYAEHYGKVTFLRIIISGYIFWCKCFEGVDKIAFAMHIQPVILNYFNLKFSNTFLVQKLYSCAHFEPF